MNPDPLDKQSGTADDPHIVRIVRLETQMDNLATVLTSLQRTVEQNHRDTLARFDDMRDRIDTLHQFSIERTDRYVRWMVGIMLAHIITTAGMLARMLMS